MVSEVMIVEVRGEVMVRRSWLSFYILLILSLPLSGIPITSLT